MVTELGMVRAVMSAQYWNALCPIEVTVLGIVTESELPIYANRVVLVLSEYTKPSSIMPFIEFAPHGLPVAVP